jgi:hypothetical protein
MRQFHPFWQMVLVGALICGPAGMMLLLRMSSPSSIAVDEKTAWYPVTGLVTEGEFPVADARVHFKGRSEVAFTDREGRFRLVASDAECTRITAAKEGYLIAGQSVSADSLKLLLRHLPSEDNQDYQWVDPRPDQSRAGNCGNCHASIYDEWQTSGHARSVTGKRFRNLYEGTDWNGKKGVGWNLFAENPLGAGVCASCHAPTMAVGPEHGLGDLREARGVAAEGVHCDYCHKVSGLGNGTIGQTHGSFNLDLLRPREGQLFFGPLDDVDRGEDAFSPLYKDSRYCASCHEGVIFGVHVYSTFSEWQASPAKREGKQCQTCHMKPTGAMTNIAPGNGGIERDPQTLANHSFFAGSQKEMLKQCLHVSSTLRQFGTDIRAEVEVAVDEVGHYVPTGFVDRHLVLVADGIDKDGKPVSAIGGPVLPLAAGKALAGHSGRLYAKLLKDFDGNSPVPFWRADPEALDSRLKPGDRDIVRITFPLAVRKVHVRLIYRRFWQDQAEIKKWPDNEITVFDQLVETPAKGR